MVITNTEDQEIKPLTPPWYPGYHKIQNNNFGMGSSGNPECWL